MLLFFMLINLSYLYGRKFVWDSLVYFLGPIKPSLYAPIYSIQYSSSPNKASVAYISPNISLFFGSNIALSNPAFIAKTVKPKFINFLTGKLNEILLTAAVIWIVGYSFLIVLITSTFIAIIVFFCFFHYIFEYS